MKNLLTFALLLVGSSPAYSADITTINKILQSDIVVNLVGDSNIRTISADTGSENVLSINYVPKAGDSSFVICFLVVENTASVTKVLSHNCVK